MRKSSSSCTFDPMNMLILEADEVGRPLPRSDRRVRHILRVLKKGRGDSLLAGVADTAVGTATVEETGPDGLILSFQPDPEGAPAAADLAPLTLILGFPRPIQAARILKDLTSLGLGRIILCGSELGEKSYMDSDFFRKREFRPALLEGAEQAASPFLPQVDTDWTLARALSRLGDSDSPRWVLDPYRSGQSLGRLGSELAMPGGHPVLAVGSERGWTEAELDLMESQGFKAASLGKRILKSETACVSAVSLALAALGRL